MVVFNGDNPTKLYLYSLQTLLEIGDEYSPRGKKIKELRPVCFEFTNPRRRVTFLGRRKINPFFQLAESLWILSGRADVSWLEKFNKNISSFSDDGVYFNAPYGERIRTWNKNLMRNFIFNPIDQLSDAYLKILNDKDTRQAVVVISNPMFDNSEYTIEQNGKDIACNLIFTFKVRDNKLHMTVFNRSNDIHWGLFGANLCQFSTIQECLCSWLKNSGNDEFSGLELGTYSHITDSLHVYLSDYGSKITEDEILKYYETHKESEVEFFNTQNFSNLEMRLSYEKFSEFLSYYWEFLDYFIGSDYIIEHFYSEVYYKDFERKMKFMKEKEIIDEYWEFVVYSILAYRLFKAGLEFAALELLSKLEDYEIKVSMLFFLKELIISRMKSEKYNGIQGESIRNCYSGMAKRVVTNFSEEGSQFRKYLKELLIIGNV